MNEAILDVRGVMKHFGGVPAVDDATFSVTAGSITSLIGPNGAGKTSLFNIISGFERAERGEIRFEGDRIDQLPTYKIVRAGLVRTFQNTKILRRMTVLENMLAAGLNHPGESLWRIASPGPRRRREGTLRTKALFLLDAVKLGSLANAYAGTLSGGQRKLLEFARALMTEPRLVLLDEPMAGVNQVLRQQLLDHILALREREDMTFLLIEHDLDTVMSVSDSIAVMSQGHVILVGTPNEVQRSTDVIDAYLGTYGHETVLGPL